jgi:glutamate synthase (NADPH/NADH) large chain
VIVQDALERKLYVIRKTASANIQRLKLKHSKEYYVPSMSSRTVIYKGLLLADQVGTYYLDLQDPRCVSALGLVHQRFSTNTFPEWPLAHPYRYIAHNGEINTVKGNYNWMKAREGVMSSPVLGADLQKLYPISFADQSDTATFDNCLELLTMAGYPISQAVMMMIPEPWEQHTTMDERRKAFYEYHAAMMEPWDGPASIVFTDGRQIGATLDRNGLRPARYCITDDDLVIMGSEAGVLPVPDSKIVRKWRLQPGKMFLIDLEQGRMIDDEELKANLANSKPYKQWIENLRIRLDDLEEDGEPASASESTVSLLDRQQAFGTTQEDIKFLLAPMAQAGEEAIGSMGNDSPLAVLSDRNKPLYNYFKQLFAQVTNPPIDPIREAIVMSLVSFIGPQAQPARHQPGQPTDAAGSEPADPRLCRHGQAARHRAAHPRQVPQRHARHHLPAALGPGGCGGQAGLAVRRSGGRDQGWQEHPDHQRPRRQRHPGGDSRSTGLVGHSPAPGARRPAHHRRSGRGDRHPPVKCTTLVCWRVTAPKPCTPTWRWKRWLRSTRT